MTGRDWPRLGRMRARACEVKLREEAAQEGDDVGITLEQAKERKQFLEEAKAEIEKLLASSKAKLEATAKDATHVPRPLPSPWRHGRLEAHSLGHRTARIA